MDVLQSDFNTPPDTKASVAAALSRYYGELSRQAPAPRFSVTRLLRAIVENTPIPKHELEVVGAAAMLVDQNVDPCRSWVPFGAIATRSMVSSSGPKGGYLLDVDAVDPVDVLRPWSVVASSGALLMTGLRTSLVIPRTTTATTATWIGEAGPAQTESAPGLGSVSLSQRTGVAFVKVSLQLLKQGPASEAFIRMQLLAAVGELLDKAYFAGAGGVEPLGMANTAGVGTQAGASLAHAGILAMRRQVLAAGGREEALAWVGAPAVQETLGARERATGGGRFLWDADGVLGRPAHSTKTAPTSTLIAGDFSQSVVGIWGPGVRIDVDPSQDFNSAGVVVRVMLLADVAFPQPAAFSVATSVT